MHMIPSWPIVSGYIDVLLTKIQIYGVALSFNPFKKRFFSLNIFVIRYLCDGSEQLKKTHSQRERI